MNGYSIPWGRKKVKKSRSALFKPGIMAATLSKKMLQSNPLRCYGVGYILLHEKKENAQRSAAPWTAPWSWSRANSRLGFPIIL